MGIHKICTIYHMYIHYFILVHFSFLKISSSGLTTCSGRDLRAGKQWVAAAVLSVPWGASEPDFELVHRH